MGATEQQGGHEEIPQPSASELLSQFDDITIKQVLVALSLTEKGDFLDFVRDREIPVQAAEHYYVLSAMKVVTADDTFKEALRLALLDKCSGRFRTLTNEAESKSSGPRLSLKQLLEDTYQQGKEDLKAALQFAQVSKLHCDVILHCWDRPLADLVKEREAYDELVRTLNFKNWNGFLPIIEGVRQETAKTVKPTSGSHRRYDTEEVPRPSSPIRRVASDTDALQSADDIRRAAEEHRRNMGL